MTNTQIPDIETFSWMDSSKACGCFYITGEIQSQTNCCVTRTGVPNKSRTFVQQWQVLRMKFRLDQNPLSIELLHQNPSVFQVKPKFIDKKPDIRYLIFVLNIPQWTKQLFLFCGQGNPPTAVHLPTKHHSVERNSHMVRRCYVSASWGSC